MLYFYIKLKYFLNIYLYMGNLVRKLGQEKVKVFDKDTDYYIDFYRKKANSSGYRGELKFKKEGPNIVIFVEINETPQL